MPGSGNRPHHRWKRLLARMRDGTAPLDFLDKVASYSTQPMKASTLMACEGCTQLRRLVQMREGNWVARLSCFTYICKAFRHRAGNPIPWEVCQRKIIEINKKKSPYSNKIGKQKEAQEMNGDVSSVLENCDERLRLQPCCKRDFWARSARPQRRISRRVQYIMLSCRKNGSLGLAHLVHMYIYTYILCMYIWYIKWSVLYGCIRIYFVYAIQSYLLKNINLMFTVVDKLNFPRKRIGWTIIKSEDSIGLVHLFHFPKIKATFWKNTSIIWSEYCMAFCIACKILSTLSQKQPDGLWIS